MAKSGAAALVLLALVAMSRRASPAPPRPPTPPRPGPLPPPPGAVTKQNTGGGGGAPWARARLAELARHGIDGDVAVSVVALWDFETAGGRAEWNWNVGNVRPVAGQASVDLGAAGRFAAYDSLAAGVTSWLQLAQGGRYAASWAQLEANPTSDAWARGLAAAGYMGPDANPDVVAAGWAGRRAALVKTGVHGVDLLSFVTALQPARPRA